MALHAFDVRVVVRRKDDPDAITISWGFDRLHELWAQRRLVASSDPNYS